MAKQDPSSKADAAAGAPDWRITTLNQIRRLIQQAEPSVVEEVKWRKPTNPGGVPVWSCNGILCTGETYKNYVKITFFHGASLADPAGLFNASLDGNARRAIDLREGQTLDTDAFMALIRAASAWNTANRAAASRTPTRQRTKPH